MRRGGGLLKRGGEGGGLLMSETVTEVSEVMICVVAGEST